MERWLLISLVIVSATLMANNDHLNNRDLTTTRSARPSIEKLLIINRDTHETLLQKCEGGILVPIVCDAVEISEEASNEVVLAKGKGRNLDLLDVALRQLSRKLSQNPKYKDFGETEDERRRAIYEKLKGFKELFRTLFQ